MGKDKSYGRGRPKIELQNNDEISVDNKYIATNELALKLMERISYFATYKLLTVTGPNSEKNNDEKKLKRKNVEKIQIKLREKIKIQEDNTFFLKDIESYSWEYDSINNELVDKNKYCLDYEEFKNYHINNNILHSIELVNNQLNSTAQKFLNEIIKQYSRKQIPEDQFKENFVNYILNNADQYQEIIKWSQLYDASYDEKLELQKLEVEQFKKKFSPNNQISQKRYKVDIKREDQLKYVQLEIQKIEKNFGENKSLKLFISEVTDILKDHWQDIDQQELMYQ